MDQLWGCTNKFNIIVIQIFQNKVLCNIVNASWYIRNEDIIETRKYIAMVEDEFKRFAGKHQKRLKNYENVEIVSLLYNNELV